MSSSAGTLVVYHSFEKTHDLYASQNVCVALGNSLIRCGVDLLEIARVERSYRRFGERFLRRFFTDGELADCGDQIQRLAVRIAAKEAVAKALGTGIGAVSWRDIEIRNAPSGRPILHLHRQAAAVAAELGVSEWDISLSHTAELATAFCVGR